MSYVIGVDQGGSGTRAAVSTLDGCLLGVGSGPGACHVFSGMEKAMQATQTAIEVCLAQAGLSFAPVEVFAGGYTGADWPDEYDLLRDAVASLGLAKSIVIVNDSIAALRGGTAQAYGAVLVAGTGANCAVRAPDGREFIYHYYHDEDLQGGSAIGRAALRAIFRAETGRSPQTRLRQGVLELLAFRDVDTLMRALVEGRLSHERIPELAPLVFAEAARGDRAARQIVSHFGEGCAELVVNGLRRLNMLNLEVEIVLSGGIFKTDNSLLLETLAAGVSREAPRARLVHARYEPVVGAVLLALEKANSGIQPFIKVNVERTASILNLVRK